MAHTVEMSGAIQSSGAVRLVGHCRGVCRYFTTHCAAGSMHALMSKSTACLFQSGPPHSRSCSAGLGILGVGEGMEVSMGALQPEAE